MLATSVLLESKDQSITLIVDLSFSVSGSTLPADHGYGLYSALIQHQQALREQPWLQVQTICGIPDSKGKIFLTRKSKLRLRVPFDQIPLVLPLAGKELSIGDHAIQLGIPQIFPLRPSSHLKARLVTIKGFTEPDLFLAAAQRQLANLGVDGTLKVRLNLEGKPDRKTIKIQRYSIVGFGLEVSGLSEKDSIQLQEHGLGGKRRMGCGIFVSSSGWKWRSEK